MSKSGPDGPLRVSKGESGFDSPLVAILESCVCCLMMWLFFFFVVEEGGDFSVSEGSERVVDSVSERCIFVEGLEEIEALPVAVDFRVDDVFRLVKIDFR